MSKNPSTWFMDAASQKTEYFRMFCVTLSNRTFFVINICNSMYENVCIKYEQKMSVLDQRKF